jgi:hypothetical protein
MMKFILLIIILIFYHSGIAQHTITSNSKKYYSCSDQIKALDFNNPYYPVFTKKKNVKHSYPVISKKDTKSTKSDTDVYLIPDTLEVLAGFEGNAYNHIIPNDNDIAISDSGLIVSVINSTIYMYDAVNQSQLMAASFDYFLLDLGFNSANDFKFDPRVIYDHESDRFIFVVLNGLNSQYSKVLVGFSQTNDPTGDWNLYALEGNPVADSSWSDFPDIGLNGTDFFITVNLRADEGEWQDAFRQTVIWQIAKEDGYNGDALLTKLWSDVGTVDRKMRYMHPVTGGSGSYADNSYFISNHNFSQECDTIYLVVLAGNVYDDFAQIDIQTMRADIPYYLAQKANQPEGYELTINDARILDGFYENAKIHFITHSLDPVTGNVGIYYGVLHNADGCCGRYITAYFKSEDEIDFGYPAVSYAGMGDSDHCAIVTFNHTSENDYSGCSAYFTDGTGGFSSRAVIKTGTSIVNFMDTIKQPWGDYSGSQPKYNEPGKVWMSGSYAYNVGADGIFGTWISELASPFVAGIEDYNQSHFSYGNIYPNPVKSNSRAFLSFDLKRRAKVRAELFTMDGKAVVNNSVVIAEQEIQGGGYTFSFSTNSISQGTYLLVLFVNDVQVEAKRIIVQ